MIDLAAISEGLAQTSPGYWETGSADDAVSYPAESSDACFGIEELSFWFAHRNDVIAAAVKRFPPRGAIFDVGSGNGFVSKGLAGCGYDVVPIEPSREGAANAVKRGLTNVVRGTLADARFHPGTLGAAGLFDVLEHIEADVEFLRTLRPLLMDGAPVYLTVPAGPWLWSIDDKAAGHFRRYTRRTLTDALAAAGFDVLHITHFFSLLSLPLALFRALPSRLGMGSPVDEHSIKREHGASRGVNKLMTRLLAGETRAVARGRSIPFGTSILAVARARGGILTT